ncbi:hypothetical protein SAMN05216582_10528 [Selenomonas ruminantium]|uniref:Uncharacterized protein n=1 Tax=Selenomonas ruminantium TaxID=971 RepID=A0A1M6SRB8_SELRU|nr:hypothetical protein [Selenomonas ruminantium]SHK47282.1 hypothetical protein SAMN05216582_10528 [Selenomonas ruminantium]
MKKNILLVHRGKSFMLNTIAKNLQNGGYEVIFVDPAVEDIEKKQR